MINSVEGRREVEEAETGDLLLADGSSDEIMKRKEDCFGGVERDVSRLVGIVEGVVGEVL